MITGENDYKKIIDDIIDKYFEQIKIAVLDFKYLKVAIYNVVPPVKKSTVWENQQYPYLGTDEERRQYHTYFNYKLKLKCLEYNYIFFDIYDKYMDKNGFLIKSLSDGNVHIKDGKYINEFLINNLR